MLSCNFLLPIEEEKELQNFGISYHAYKLLPWQEILWIDAQKNKELTKMIYK